MHISNSCDEKNRIGWPIAYNHLHYYRTENLHHNVFTMNAAIVLSRTALLVHIAILSQVLNYYLKISTVYRTVLSIGSDAFAGDPIATVVIPT
jgi:hypothetical protein